MIWKVAVVVLVGDNREGGNKVMVFVRLRNGTGSTVRDTEGDIGGGTISEEELQEVKDGGILLLDCRVVESHTATNIYLVEDNAFASKKLRP